MGISDTKGAPVVKGPGLTGRRLYLGLAAALVVVLTGCQFQPETPVPDGDRSIVIGLRHWVNTYGNATVTAEVEGTNTSVAEITELAGEVATVFGGRAGSALDVRYSNQFGGVTSVRAGLPVTESTSQGRVFNLDVAAARDSVAGAGFDLGYLHWCPPYGYDIGEVSAIGPRIEADFGCVVFDSATGFPSVAVELGSQRSALVSNAVFHVAMLGTAMAAVVLFIASRNGRRSLWPVWLTAWFILAGLAGPLLGAFTASTSEVLALEPGGSLADHAIGFLAWVAFLAGPTALLIIVIAGVLRTRKRLHR